MLRHLFGSCYLNLLGLLFISQAHAGISLSATRLVFDGQHKEASITVRNNGADVLIQSWIDRDTLGVSTVPLAVTPPLARLNGEGKQLLRVIYEGKGMPADKESVVWLNVQEIPQVSKTPNTLQLAVRQRIKVFFRPAGMSSVAYLAPTELLWKLEDNAEKTALIVRNPGRYHVSIANISLQSGKLIEQPFDSMMIAPGEHKSFPLKQFNRVSSLTLSFGSINDYGAQDRYVGQLFNNKEIQASLSKESH